MAQIGVTGLDTAGPSAAPVLPAVGGAGSVGGALPPSGAEEPIPASAATATPLATVDPAEITAAVSKDGLKVDVVSGRLHSVYDVGKAIGKGKFSTVYKAIRRADGVAVALKQIAIFDMMDEKSRDKCLKEIKLVQSLNHENIIRYLDGFIEEKQLILVFEYAGWFLDFLGWRSRLYRDYWERLRIACLLTLLLLLRLCSSSIRRTDCCRSWGPQAAAS